MLQATTGPERRRKYILSAKACFSNPLRTFVHGGVGTQILRLLAGCPSPWRWSGLALAHYIASPYSASAERIAPALQTGDLSARVRAGRLTSGKRRDCGPEQRLQSNGRGKFETLLRSQSQLFAGYFSHEMALAAWLRLTLAAGTRQGLIALLKSDGPASSGNLQTEARNGSSGCCQQLLTLRSSRSRSYFIPKNFSRACHLFLSRTLFQMPVFEGSATKALRDSYACGSVSGCGFGGSSYEAQSKMLFVIAVRYTRESSTVQVSLKLHNNCRTRFRP